MVFEQPCPKNCQYCKKSIFSWAQSSIFFDVNFGRPFTLILITAVLYKDQTLVQCDAAILQKDSFGICALRSFEYGQTNKQTGTTWNMY